ncbi:hypothetical protein TMU3MR103_1098 [Tetragenococcus muriaticus 3MR10-3]|uniref:Uncharacterized protein n=1 Tax=Tetragenococcus muriaticus 3MR10-3 TaxID=1302648 RepID=A0A091C0A5_9ENTE|nr:hypothetical protein TMU3MR103_1098 [Tetragenococcus muriaticus 3MR10-3]
MMKSQFPIFFLSRPFHYLNKKNYIINFSDKAREYVKKVGKCPKKQHFM